MQKEDEARGRPSLYEGTLSPVQFDKVVSELGDSKITQRLLDAARRVLVDGVSTAEVAADMGKSRQYLHQVVVRLSDRANGIVEVKERLPAYAAEVVQELAAACRAGGRQQIEEKLIAVRALTEKIRATDKLLKFQKLYEDLEKLAQD